MSAARRLRMSWVSFLLLALIIVVSGWWRAVNLDAFGISNDEGTHLMWARLANEGYPLYDQTRAVQGPFFVGLIQLSFKLLGTRVASGRWVEIGLGLVTLLGVGLLARRLQGWTAAWVAAATLSIAPLFFHFSRMVRGDVAASAFLILAILSGYAFYSSGRRVWLGVAGVLLAANLLVKAIAPLGFLLILLLILQRRLESPRESHRQDPESAGSRNPWQNVGLLKASGPLLPVSDILIDGLVLGLAVALPIGICFLVYEPAGLFDALVTFRLDLRAVNPWNPAANLAEFGTFLQRYVAMAALAIYGWLYLFLTGARLRGHTRDTQGAQQSMSGARAWAGDAAVMGLWVVTTLFTLMTHTPLFTHHLISLLLPMAVLTGVAAEGAIHSMRQWRSGDRLGRAWGLAGLLLIAFYVASVPGWLAEDQHSRTEVTGGRERDAIELLRTVTTSHDFIISDNQMLPFMADRLSPPPLGDIALVAIQSGRQTAQRLITLSNEYEVEAVATWSHRLPWLPAYLDWAEKNYLVKRVWDDQHIIYFGRRISADQVPNRVDAQLGGSIKLLGYHLERNGSAERDEQRSALVSQPLEVTLYWLSDAPVNKDYTVSVQVVGPDGHLIAQHDSQPMQGYLPTGDWVPGEVIPDRHRLTLPADTPPGHYQLVTGMYDLETMERLPVSRLPAQGTDSLAILTELEIGAGE